MSNSIAYGSSPATMSTFATGTFSLEAVRISQEAKREATLCVQSWLPADEARDVLETLGLLPPRSQEA